MLGERARVHVLRLRLFKRVIKQCIDFSTYCGVKPLGDNIFLNQENAQPQDGLSERC